MLCHKLHRSGLFWAYPKILFTEHGKMVPTVLTGSKLGEREAEHGGDEMEWLETNVKDIKRNLLISQKN